MPPPSTTPQRTSNFNLSFDAGRSPFSSPVSPGSFEQTLLTLQHTFQQTLNQLAAELSSERGRSERLMGRIVELEAKVEKLLSFNANTESNRSRKRAKSVEAETEERTKKTK